ncbi:MAG: hypothetical protein HC869_07490 [Rhodospirillales bacterium]|nr:hypothetical protein [Rhodospirillales bacterium]
MNVFERTARHDRQHAYSTAFVDHTRKLGGKPQRRALEQAGGEPDTGSVEFGLHFDFVGAALLCWLSAGLRPNERQYQHPTDPNGDSIHGATFIQ